jgi:hypothetical protein
MLAVASKAASKTVCIHIGASKGYVYVYTALLVLYVLHAAEERCGCLL